MKVLVTQSCLTLHDPTDCKLPGSSVHGILQARILEWVAISFSKGYDIKTNKQGNKNCYYHGIWGGGSANDKDFQAHWTHCDEWCQSSSLRKDKNLPEAGG